jgi:predicted dehydrogenase
VSSGPQALRAAIIGVGFAGATHAEALARIPGVELAAVVASSPQSARAAGARLRVEHTEHDYRKVLADPSIDVVHNCTPNDLHAEINLAVLEAGKHLVAEKPLATGASETAALAEAAQAHDVASAVCFNYRYYPLVRELRSLLASGEYGQPHLVHGAYLQDWLLSETDWNWRVDAARGGPSRAVADIGSHWLDLAEFVTQDRIVSVSARLGRLHDRRRRPGEVQTFAQSVGEGTEIPVVTEDMACLVLEFASGCLGSVVVSQVSAGRKNRLHLSVDAATAGFAWDQEEPNLLWIGHRDRANEQLPRDPALLGTNAAGLAHYPGGHQEGWADTFKNLFLDVYATIEAHRSGTTREGSFASFVDAHHSALLVEAILASDRENRPVGVAATRQPVA